MENWHLYLIIGGILIGSLVLSRVIRWLIAKSLLSEDSKIKTDVTRVKFIKNAASFIIWLIATGLIVFQIPDLKSIAVTIFAGAGILLAAIGFAAQEAFSNIVSGIFIVIFRPFRVGDMIKVGEQSYGLVEDITLRHTVIVNFENKRLIIPNSRVSSDVIINDSIQEPKVCRYIEVGIGYSSDVELAMRLIQEEAEKHPRILDNRTEEEMAAKDPIVEVVVLSFGEYSVNLRAYAWTDNPLQALRMHSDINIAIKKRFEKEGIEIPFPYRNMILKESSVSLDSSRKGS
ncbi:MAG: mechanosensitive ion channel family protein [bacterium]|nr:mechanosensitive ion channel family protein [bacterium]